jgi:hypothetical protein
LKKEKKRKRGEGGIECRKVFSDNRGGSYYQEMEKGEEIFLIISGLHNT